MTSSLTPVIIPTATYTATRTATQTPFPGQNRVTMAVYNSAGELVAFLGELNLAIAPSGLTPLNVVFIPEEGQIGVFALDGISLLLEWDGKVDTGEIAESGTYQVVMSVNSPLGTTSSYSATMTVIRNVSEIEVDIYNSAGERVASIPSASDRAGQGLSVSSQATASGGMVHTIRFGDRPQDQVIWDERNGEGERVDQGTYRIRVRQVSNHGSIPLLSGSVTVLHLDEGDPGLVAGPNPLLPGQPLVVQVGSAQRVVSARLFNLAGEDVAQVGEMPSLFTWNLDTSKLASGVYVLVVEIQTVNGDMNRLKQKVSLLK